MPFKKLLTRILLSTIMFSMSWSFPYAAGYETKSSGRTLQDDALFDAVLEGDIQKAIESIKQGAFPGKKHDGKPLLMYAIEEGHQDIAKLLLQKGADQNAADEDGRTVLMCAAANGDKETVKLLLSKGAIVSSKDDSGRIALMYALRGYRYWDREKDLSADYLDILKALLPRCNDVNYRDYSNETLLMYSVRAAWPDAVKLLLSSKSVQVNFKNKEDNTALDIAQKELSFSVPTAGKANLTVEKADFNKARDEIIDMLKKAGARSKLTW